VLQSTTYACRINPRFLGDFENRSGTHPELDSNEDLREVFAHCLGCCFPSCGEGAGGFLRGRLVGVHVRSYVHSLCQPEDESRSFGSGFGRVLSYAARALTLAWAAWKMPAEYPSERSDHSIENWNSCARYIFLAMLRHSEEEDFMLALLKPCSMVAISRASCAAACLVFMPDVLCTHYAKRT
jgi:hypothetical protein